MLDFSMPYLSRANTTHSTENYAAQMWIVLGLRPACVRICNDHLRVQGSPKQGPGYGRGQLWMQEKREGQGFFWRKFKIIYNLDSSQPASLITIH